MSDNGVNAHEQPLTVADGVGCSSSDAEDSAYRSTARQIGTTRMPLGAIQADVDKHDATSASLQQMYVPDPLAKVPE